MCPKSCSRIGIGHSFPARRRFLAAASAFVIDIAVCFYHVAASRSFCKKPPTHANRDPAAGRTSIQSNAGYVIIPCWRSPVVRRRAQTMPRGFTLVELLAVIGIIAILLALLVS